MKNEKSLSKLGIVFITLFLFLSSGFAFAGSVTNWELVLEHDAAGTVITGSLDNLIAEVNNGAEIKVLYYGNWTGATSDYIAVKTSANGVLGVNYPDSGPVVWLQNGTYFQTTDSTGVSSLAEDTKGVTILKTNGVQEVLMYNASMTTVTDHLFRNIKMKWFISK